MAKGQHLSAYQQKIVKRYYEHLDTITLQKLGELVSELYLATGDEKKSAKLWTQTEGLLSKAGVEAAKVRKIVGARDVKGLAALVNEAAGKG